MAIWPRVGVDVLIGIIVGFVIVVVAVLEINVGLGDLFDKIGREPAPLVATEAVPPARLELGDDLDQIVLLEGEGGGGGGGVLGCVGIEGTDDDEGVGLEDGGRRGQVGGVQVGGGGGGLGLGHVWGRMYVCECMCVYAGK